MTTDIFSVFTQVELAKKSGISFSEIRSVTLNQTDTFTLQPANNTRYIIYINVAYSTPNNTLTAYDSLGNAVLTYTINQPIYMKLEYVNYSKITFSEPVQTSTYQIGLFYTIARFKTSEDAQSVIPAVDIHPNLPDVATNAEIIELQQLINDLNADTATGLKDLAEIINTQTLQLSFKQTTAEGVYVNNLPSVQNVQLKGTPDVQVTNFPATQNVNIENFPSTQDVQVTNIPQVQPSPTTNNYTKTTADSVQLTTVDAYTNSFILTNNSSNTVYVGFSPDNQNILLSPNGFFTYTDSNIQVNINTLYVTGSNVNLTLTYWS